MISWSRLLSLLLLLGVEVVVVEDGLAVPVGMAAVVAGHLVGVL